MPARRRLLAEGSSEPTRLPEEAWVAALAGLPKMGPIRLRAVLTAWSPSEAWRRLGAGSSAHTPAVVAACGREHAAVAPLWAAAVRSIDVGANWHRHAEAGVGVAGWGSAAMPAPLRDDLEPPAVLFHRGQLCALDAPRVGIVGTRSCTGYGRDVAFELGHDLARAGVSVISGLALGIDGAAHAGAVAAASGNQHQTSTATDPEVAADGSLAVGRPIAVVANGLDIVYPLRNRPLWRAVEQHGVVFSEVPLGTSPERWRFPARNRLIAALSDVLVVVESHSGGGSMHTVNEAERRGRTVLAVPGPIRSPASAGTNRLLAEGAAPVCDVGDVLMALGLSPGAARPGRSQASRSTGDEAVVLDAFGWRPATLEQLCEATGLGPGDVAVAVVALEESGQVRARGAWYERVAHAS